jgi:hypothetical protein
MTKVGCKSRSDRIWEQAASFSRVTTPATNLLCHEPNSLTSGTGALKWPRTSTHATKCLALRMTFPRLWAKVVFAWLAPRRSWLQILCVRGFSGKDRALHLRQVGCSRCVAFMDLSLDGLVRQMMDWFGKPVCSAKRLFGVDKFCCETGRRSRLHSPAFGIVLPERLLHVEQFCHFASFCASVLFFRRREPNREPATESPQARTRKREPESARVQSQDLSDWLWVSHMKVTQFSRGTYLGMPLRAG